MHLKSIVQEHNVQNIIGYLRKSRQDLERERRTGEDTLSEQRELMTNVLDSIELPYSIETEIESGESISGRPVFQKVLKDLENKKFQAIAVKELSRLSRGNYSDAGKIIQTITDNRLIIITPYKIYEPRNPMDMKQIRFELFLAREEYEMIKERMVNARYLYASQGKWVAGDTPYGYRYEKSTQKLAPNEDKVKVVKMIYDLFLNGLNGKEVSFQAIASYLSNIGIPTAKGKHHWSYVQIKKILTNEVYKGTIKFRTVEKMKNGKRMSRPESEHIVVEDAHEPIIDKETWEEVNTKILNKKPLPHNPLDFDPCELASICVCSLCKSKLIRNSGKRTYKKQDGTESIYYKEFLQCQRNYCMNVKYRDVEKAILRYFNFLSEIDDVKLNQHLQSVIIQNNDDEFTMTKEELLNQVKKKEKELKERMNFIYEKYEQKIYTDEMFLERKNTIDEELILLDKTKETLESDHGFDKQFDTKQIKLNAKEWVEAYNSLESKESKNKLLRSILDRVEVTIVKKGHGRTPAKFKIAPYLRESSLNP